MTSRNRPIPGAALRARSYVSVGATHAGIIPALYHRRMLEVDPPDLRIVATCTCTRERRWLHAVRESSEARIDWLHEGCALRDVRHCLRCAMPLRVERVDGQQAAGG